MFSGSVIGNNKKGVFLRSQDPDRESFIQECPCQVNIYLEHGQKPDETMDTHFVFVANLICSQFVLSPLLDRGRDIYGIYRLGG